MEFGLYPITVSNVFKDDTQENTYIIRGENFTTYSRIYVNGNQEETHYIDSNTLQLTYEGNLESTDIINVWQSHLTCTDDYQYNVINMELTDEAKEKLGQE